jgi:hypothetical protein
VPLLVCWTLGDQSRGLCGVKDWMDTKEGRRIQHEMVARFAESLDGAEIITTFIGIWYCGKSGVFPANTGLDPVKADWIRALGTSCDPQYVLDGVLSALQAICGPVIITRIMRGAEPSAERPLINESCKKLMTYWTHRLRDRLSHQAAYKRTMFSVVKELLDYRFAMRHTNC